MLGNVTFEYDPMKFITIIIDCLTIYTETYETLHSSKEEA